MKSQYAHEKYSTLLILIEIMSKTAWDNTLMLSIMVGKVWYRALDSVVVVHIMNILNGPILFTLKRLKVLIQHYAFSHNKYWRLKWSEGKWSEPKHLSELLRKILVTKKEPRHNGENVKHSIKIS